MRTVWANTGLRRDSKLASGLPGVQGDKENTTYVKGKVKLSGPLME